MVREARVERQTRETQIQCIINLDGSGKYTVETPSGFFTHMLESFACHGRFDLDLAVQGDVHVDLHHTVEDTGLVLGMAIDGALGERTGIERAGFWLFPMDEALVQVAVDLGGRPFSVVRGNLPQTSIGNFSTDLVHDFLYGLSVGLRANVHVHFLYGRSAHHLIEAMFKGLGKALRVAVRVTGGRVPSTKGQI